MRRKLPLSRVCALRRTAGCGCLFPWVCHDASHTRILRRTFLQHTGLVLPAVLAAPALRGQSAAKSALPQPARPELAADLVSSAAPGAAPPPSRRRDAAYVIMTERPTGWRPARRRRAPMSALIRRSAAPAVISVRQRIRDYYARNFPLTGARQSRLNPGNGGVRKLCHEPGSPRGLREMLASHVAGRRVGIFAAAPGDFGRDQR